MRGNIAWWHFVTLLERTRAIISLHLCWHESEKISPEYHLFLCYKVRSACVVVHSGNQRTHTKHKHFFFHVMITQCR